MIGNFSGSLSGSGTVRGSGSETSTAPATVESTRRNLPRSTGRQIFVPMQAGVPVRAGALPVHGPVEVYPGQGVNQPCTVGLGPNEAQYGPNYLVTNTNLQPVVLHVRNLSEIWLYGSQAAGAGVGVFLAVRGE